MDEPPIFVDIRSQSNSAAMFLTIAAESAFVKPGDFFGYDNAAVLFTLLKVHQITPIALPTYSPELNPIDRCFGVVKSFLRYNRNAEKS